MSKLAIEVRLITSDTATFQQRLDVYKTCLDDLEDGMNKIFGWDQDVLHKNQMRRSGGRAYGDVIAAIVAHIKGPWIILSGCTDHHLPRWNALPLSHAPCWTGCAIPKGVHRELFSGDLSTCND